MNKFLPKKHISLEASYIGFGAELIKLIVDNMTVDQLWAQCNINCVVKHSFDDLILTLDFLYTINAISISNEGLICLN